MHANEDGPVAVAETATLGRRVPLSPRARTLLLSAGTPAAFLNQLLEEGRYADAVPVQACLMPVRQAVWWGVLSAWHAAGGQPSGAADQALGAAVRWVLAPTAAQARVCAGAADAASLDNAPGCCARAAALAGTQPAPGSPFVSGLPLLAAKLVASAVAFSCARTREREPGVTHRHFLELGRDIAAGKYRWEPSTR